MASKLYVSNVPVEASEHTLRAHFATCGGVSDVEILFDPRTGKSKCMARVTMTSPAYATAALERLDGIDFEGQALVVRDTPAGKEKPAAPRVKVLQQSRTHGQMVYDLDCMGTPLTVRMSMAEGDVDAFRLEARGSDVAGAFVATATAATRRGALADVVRIWNEDASSRGVPPLEGDALAAALQDVRAV